MTDTYKSKNQTTIIAKSMGAGLDKNKLNEDILTVQEHKDAKIREAGNKFRAKYNNNSNNKDKLKALRKEVDTFLKVKSK